MKNTRITKNTLGLGAVLALAFGLSSSAFAGPGFDYWQRMQQQREQKYAQASAMSCLKCKTEAVEQLSSADPVGKGASYFKKVGAKHDCENCGGTITTINGKTTNEMTANCPICAKANPTCCNTKS